ncbi:Hsp20/alpha crystallin family protein [Actinopolyspora mzabensis]|nr:Hsp20/alpha crystallin family protein [Actinopolyspora mzabensis]
MRFDPFRDMDRLAEQLAAASRSPRAMPLEAYRHGDQFMIHLDLPGVDPADVELTVERNVLSISAKRGTARRESDELLVDERPQGTFSRQLFLGENLDLGKLTANYEGGVLTLTVPVAEESKPRQVPIASGEQVPQQLSSENVRDERVAEREETANA